MAQALPHQPPQGAQHWLYQHPAVLRAKSRLYQPLADEKWVLKASLRAAQAALAVLSSKEQGACRQPLPRWIHRDRHQPVAQNLWGDPAELWRDLNSPQPLPRPWTESVFQAQQGPSGALASSPCRHRALPGRAAHPRATCHVPCHAHATSLSPLPASLRCSTPRDTEANSPPGRGHRVQGPGASVDYPCFLCWGQQWDTAVAQRAQPTAGQCRTEDL